MPDVVISAACQVLAHVPSLTRHGSKPRRELPKAPDVAAAFASSLRTFDQAVGYPANQAYVNALHPRDLPARPWTELPGSSRWSGGGEIMPEAELLGLLAAVDDFDLLTLSPAAAARAVAGLARHPLAKRLDLDRVERAQGDVDAVASEAGALNVIAGEAAFRCGQSDDEALSAHVLIDNLAAKATATLALLHLLERHGIDPASVDYVLGCGEEAIGDRYQRGGGNLAKAVAEAAGLTEASGADIKNFCAAPVPALVIAASLVAAGVFGRVAVVGGGCMAKLGMKFQGHLKHSMPILEDVLGGAAALVEDWYDGRSARDPASTAWAAVFKVSGGRGVKPPRPMEALAGRAADPVGPGDDGGERLRHLSCSAPRMTRPPRGGRVPERVYRSIAALAAREGNIAGPDPQRSVTEQRVEGLRLADPGSSGVVICPYSPRRTDPAYHRRGQ